MTARREVVALYETGAGAWPSNCGRSPSMHAHDGALLVQIVADGRAISPVHAVAAIGDADEVARLAGDGEARRREADADGGVPGGDVLADAAPAQPRDDRLGVGPVADRAA